MIALSTIGGDGISDIDFTSWEGSWESLGGF